MSRSFDSFGSCLIIRLLFIDKKIYFATADDASIDNNNNDNEDNDENNDNNDEMVSSGSGDDDNDEDVDPEWVSVHFIASFSRNVSS